MSLTQRLFPALRKMSTQATQTSKPQFLVFVYDYPNNFDRRQEVRPRHLERARDYRKDGFLITGGALLDEQNRMIGSSLIVASDTQEEAKKVLLQDPYTVDKVWDPETMKIYPFRVASV
ncbi:uncharacterized protein VTP21DRAFT_4901 [Calcarisporiella thermophila]|uniref:uncharacterized protein n=1 Tax=Calcarisporiella thermophila TaxID=911321 RepID=UPI003743DB3D